ncbi:hypothetical protein [Allokutzneria sp. A3M-2-11 16]|nr:hypothetical protein [Allokutzneria sp. A3M-2-11 16]
MANETAVVRALSHDSLPCTRVIVTHRVGGIRDVDSADLRISS